jgi:hypothetical protein
LSVQRGETLWVIPDGYIPPISTGDLESHESICVLNTNETDAQLIVNVYFEDQPPLEGIPLLVPAKRTLHARTTSLKSGAEIIPKGVPYAMEVLSDIPVYVQYSRLDATQPANALMSVMAYPVRTNQIT